MGESGSPRLQSVCDIGSYREVVVFLQFIATTRSEENQQQEWHNPSVNLT
jgi:hypothetical protein